MRGPKRERAQSWRTFLRNQIKGIWAADLFVVQTIGFQSLYVFFFIRRERRELIHFNVTASATAAWIWKQVIAASAWGRQPGHLIHDRDNVYGGDFGAKLAGIGIAGVRTTYRAPLANSVAERVVRTFRQECLDHIIVLNERHLLALLTEFVRYYNHDRPHRTFELRTPVPHPLTTPPDVAVLRGWGNYFRWATQRGSFPRGVDELVELAQSAANPNEARIAQQARNLTWTLEEEGIKLKAVIHDRDKKFSARADNVFRSAGAGVILTPLMAPRANAYIERWIGSCRRECLDWMLVVSQRHLEAILREYCMHYNQERPHRSRELRPPAARGDPVVARTRPVRRRVRLGGLISSTARRRPPESDAEFERA